jgi:hypothetical protein
LSGQGFLLREASTSGFRDALMQATTNSITAVPGTCILKGVSLASANRRAILMDTYLR